MVSPVNSPGATASCQKCMFQCGLLQQLCTILMATGVPADILTEVTTESTDADPPQEGYGRNADKNVPSTAPFQTINTVSEVIRGSQINQDYFASVNAPSSPPR